MDMHNESGRTPRPERRNRTVTPGSTHAINAPKRCRPRRAHKDMPVSRDAAMNLGPLIVMAGETMSVRWAHRTNSFRWTNGSEFVAAAPLAEHEHKARRLALRFPTTQSSGVNSQASRAELQILNLQLVMPIAFRKVGPCTLERRLLLRALYISPGVRRVVPEGETSRGVRHDAHTPTIFIELRLPHRHMGYRGTWFTISDPVSPPLVQLPLCIGPQRPRIPRRFTPFEDSSHILRRVHHRIYYRWSSWKGRYLMAASLMRTGTTSTPIAGIHAQRDCHSPRTITGQCRSVTVSCVVRKRLSRVTCDARRHRLVITNR